MSQSTESNMRRYVKPCCAALGFITLAAFLFLAFWPFKWQPPTRVSNGARVTESGSLRFGSPGIAKMPMPEPWVDSVRKSNRFRLRLRARALDPKQQGPARLFTISDGRAMRNFTVGHDRTSLVIRLRSPATSENGVPQYRVSKVFKTGEWRDIDLRVEPGELTVWIDGKLERREPIPPNALAGWNPSFQTALGNEVTGDRPWLGEIAEAKIEVGGKTIDYLAPNRLVIPESFWDGLAYRPAVSFSRLNGPDSSVLDAVLNLLGFVVLGFLWSMARLPSRSLMPVVVGCSLLSLATELAQTSFDEHVPSETDWILNTLGAAIGAYVALKVYFKLFAKSESEAVGDAPLLERTPQSETSHR